MNLGNWLRSGSGNKSSLDFFRDFLAAPSQKSLETLPYTLDFNVGPGIGYADFGFGESSFRLNRCLSRNRIDLPSEDIQPLADETPHYITYETHLWISLLPWSSQTYNYHIFPVLRPTTPWLDCTYLEAVCVLCGVARPTQTMQVANGELQDVGLLQFAHILSFRLEHTRSV